MLIINTNKLMTLFKNLNLCAQLKWWKMSYVQKPVIYGGFFVNFRCIIYWKKCRCIDYCFPHEKFSTGLTNTSPKGNISLIAICTEACFSIKYWRKYFMHFFPPKADLRHLLAVLDKASESQSRRESNCTCNVTKTGTFIMLVSTKMG